jgi:hypothetical protein
MRDYLFLDNKSRIEFSVSGQNFANVPTLRGEMCYVSLTYAVVTLGGGGLNRNLRLRMLGVSPLNYYSSDNRAVPVLGFLNRISNNLYIKPTNAPNISILINDRDLNHIVFRLENANQTTISTGVVASGNYILELQYLDQPNTIHQIKVSNL